MRWFITFVAATIAATPASAAWYQAKSKHFIIYADERPADLAAFAAKLEKFDTAVRDVRLMDDPAIGDGNRLTVFVLDDDEAVRRLEGDKSGMIYGYYEGHASGPVAFVPRTTGAHNSDELHPETVFFHEYAHHLMFQVLDKSYPRWLVEGFAEFLSTARFNPDGSVSLGLPAMHRAYGVYDRDNRLDVASMLGDSFSKLDGMQEEWFYSRSWLLVHYLTFEPTRRGQLDRYVDSIAKGAAPLDAAKSAFGDLQRLDLDLDVYSHRSQFAGMTVKPRDIQQIPIDVSPLSEGAGRAVLYRAQTRSGVTGATSGPLVDQVRALEKLYPGDELVEVELAEAELDARHPAEAEGAADRALRANPRNTDALVLKGRAMIARTVANKSIDPKPFDEARRIFISANQIDTEDPEPLMEYYRSYGEQGLGPTANALAALHYASNLAPQDEGLRLTSAIQYLREGKAPEARQTLAPIAFDPHGGGYAKAARELIAKIDGGDVKGALAIGESSDADEKPSH
jgi:hypothetical protein